MWRPGFLRCALHISIVYSLVLNLLAVQEASSNKSSIQFASKPTQPNEISHTNASGSTSSTTSKNVTSSVGVTLCNGAHFTRPSLASYFSCQDAFQYIRRGPVRQTVGDRASGDWDFVLPHRWLSGNWAFVPTEMDGRADFICI